jgi:peptidoglycan/xylan/chitin deacetylase (PgdA/CDA1 family)
MKYRGSVFFLVAAAMLPAQKVALTFDDLPYTGALPRNMTRLEIVKDIVKILQDAKAPQVYGFMNGGKGDVEDLKAWTAAGFPLANHGYSHLNLAEVSLRQYIRDIKANEPILRSLVPNEDQWHWFRYPYLEEGETLRKKHAVTAYLKANHYRVAEVSLDFEDFLWNAPYARCVARHNAKCLEWLKSTYLTMAADRIELGQKMSQALYGRDIKYIMLLHVGGFETVMLPELLKLLEHKHFKLITLEEAASDPAYQKDPDWPTAHGGDFLTLSMHRRGFEIPKHLRYPRAQLSEICTTRSGEIPPDPDGRPSQPGRHRKTHQSTPTQ